jgi:hypothetical protein
VSPGTSEEEAIREFNSKYAEERGKEVTDLEPYGNGDWRIVAERPLGDKDVSGSGDSATSGEGSGSPADDESSPIESAETESYSRPGSTPKTDATEAEAPGATENSTEKKEEGFWKSIVSGKEQPSFGKSLIPILGSVQSANYHFDKGNWVRGTIWTAVAISDVFLVGTIIKGVGKVIVKGGVALATSEFFHGVRLMFTGNWRAKGETLRLLFGKSKFGPLEILWNPKLFVDVSKQYWRGTANQLGMQLQHLWAMNSTRWVPTGLRNSGLNLLEIPKAFNHWMSNGVSNQVFRLGVGTLVKADFLGSYSITQWIFGLHDEPVLTQESTP